MQRIQDPTAVAAEPAKPALSGTTGFFTNGNPGLGQPATVVPDWWLNMTQEELCAILTAAGLPLDGSKTVLQGIQALIGSAGGAFLPLAGGTLSGSLTVDGTLHAVGATTLAAVSSGDITSSGAISAQGAIGSSTGLSSTGSLSVSGSVTLSGAVSSNLGMQTSGSVGVGTDGVNSPVTNSTTGCNIVVDGHIDSNSPNGCLWASGSPNFHVFAAQGGSILGSIAYTGTAIAYNTSSDERLKVNITPLTGALARIRSVPVYQFNMIDQVTSDNPDPPKVDGFLAHELTVGNPSAVTGTRGETQTFANAVVAKSGAVLASGISEADFLAGQKPIEYVPPVIEPGTPAVDAVPATETTAAISAKAAIPDKIITPCIPGRLALYPADATWRPTITVPVYQQADYSKNVPLLWAGWQELDAAITAMQAEIATLRAQVTTPTTH
ncbi:MAG TPA: tail fiber domain-containing protein [Paenirhodobacter sp.]